jgi:hypothetical protein
VFSFIAGSRRYRRYNEMLSQIGLRLLENKPAEAAESSTITIKVCLGATHFWAGFVLKRRL